MNEQQKPTTLTEIKSIKTLKPAVSRGTQKWISDKSSPIFGFLTEVLAVGIYIVS